MVGVLVLVRDLGCAGGFVGLDEPLGCCGSVAIHWASVPDVELRAVLRRVETGDGLTGGEPHISSLDPGLLGEGLSPLLAQILHCSAGDGDRIALRLVNRAAGQGQGTRGGDGKQGGEQPLPHGILL